MLIVSTLFKQTLSRAFCLSAAVVFCCTSTSAWALFNDDDARKVVFGKNKTHKKWAIKRD
jgi:hypothetical protein